MDKLIKPKILIVDDEKSIQFLLKNILTENNYDVITADNGNDALERISSELPDIVLLDVMMPGMNGFEVLEKIKASENLKNISVILITAKTEPEELKKGFEKGAFDYIKKPFNEIELLARLSAAVKLISYIRKLEDALDEIKYIFKEG